MCIRDSQRRRYARHERSRIGHGSIAKHSRLQSVVIFRSGCHARSALRGARGRSRLPSTYQAGPSTRDARPRLRTGSSLHIPIPCLNTCCWPIADAAPGFFSAGTAPEPLIAIPDKLPTEHSVAMPCRAPSAARKHLIMHSQRQRACLLYTSRCV